MANRLNKGSGVEWQAAPGKTSGKVEKKVTSTTKVQGHVAKATKEQPQYLVKSDKSGKKAVHKPDALKAK